ncbi:hypothetical protein KY317_02290 [Candidatus Woesearchaeota archaeon]|nr:hypothetical protein [Candidatus Woesearchaeota archaeon]
MKKKQPEEIPEQPNTGEDLEQKTSNLLPYAALIAGLALAAHVAYRYTHPESDPSVFDCITFLAERFGAIGLLVYGFHKQFYKN